MMASIEPLHDSDAWQTLLAVSKDRSESCRSEVESSFESSHFFRLYGKIALAAQAAKQNGELFVCAHLAQTLDGKISCENGHSQWISNQDNLIHAHRMRALCDAVLVGWKTVRLDDCKLNVRHVKAEDPYRVVLDPRGQLLKDPAEKYKIFQFDDGKTIYLTQNYSEAVEKLSCRVVQFDESPLETLHTLGLASVFIEGGPTTVSSLLSEIDIFHLHVSPKILGSGRDSIKLNPVENINDCVQMTTTPFLLGGEVLYECLLR